MDQETSPSREPPRDTVQSMHANGRPGFVGHLRTWLLTGILVTAPIVITLYVTWAVVNFVDDVVTPWIPARYQPETYLHVAIPGLGLLVMVVVLTLIGGLTASLLGRYFLSLSDQILARMPVVRGLYGATKQIVETVFSSKGNAFRSVVLVEFPRSGAWSLGFISGTTAGEVRHHLPNDMVNVFVPTTPNPTSGYLIFVPRKDVIELRMTVEEGIKMIVSGGIVTPVDREQIAAQPDAREWR